MDFSSAVLACLREVELSAVSLDAAPTDEPVHAPVDSNNMDATMLMADGVAIGYTSRRKKRAKKIVDSNLPSQVIQESDPPPIRPASISQSLSQPAFTSQPDEDDDSISNAWHFHAIVIAEKPSEPGSATISDGEIPGATAADPLAAPPATNPSATLIVLRDMQPVFDLGTLSAPSPIIKGLKRVPFDRFGLKFKSLDPGEEGRGSITLSHWTDAPGMKKKAADKSKPNRYELKTIVLHVFSGLHAQSLVDPSSETSGKKIKALNPTTEASLVAEALEKALVDLRLQALTVEEEGGPSFGISKHEERLNEAIPSINKSILSILSGATNAHLLPFVLDLFNCSNEEDLGDALFLATCETVISSKSKGRAKKEKVKKGVGQAGDVLLPSSVVEMSQEQFFTQGMLAASGDQEENVEVEEEEERREIERRGGKRVRSVNITVDPLLERRHAAYGGMRPKEVHVIESSECDWF